VKTTLAALAIAIVAALWWGWQQFAAIIASTGAKP
jgi:hypothetical protein